MKKVLAGLLCLMMVLVCASALAETVIGKAEIVTQFVIWVLCGVLTAVSALATWAVKTYVIPWMNTVAVPWLKQNHLLEAAKVAVEYAEAIVGRFNGEEKLQLALTVLESKGWDIKSDAVLQALKAKWQELNLAQVAAGVKGTVNSDVDAVSSSLV